MTGLLAATSSQPADPTTTYVIIGAGCVFLIYAMSRMSKRQRKRDPDTFFTRNSLAQERRAQQDMENVLVELSKMSRELSAQLDTRATKLEVLIADADERAARLQSLLKQAPARPDFARVESQSPAADALQKLMQSAAASPPVFAEPARPPDDMAPSPPIEPSHAEIYRLADEGRSVGQIAGELSRPSGEVELILALRPRS